VELRAEDLIAAVEERWGAPCQGCSRALVGHEIVLSTLLGFGAAHRCIECLAAGVGRKPDDLLRQALANIRRLDCYRAGWLHSDRRLRRDGDYPHARLAGAPDLLDADDDPGPVPAIAGAADPESAAAFDAGEMACGDLVLELRARLALLARGQVLRVRATDPGAVEDLPAWSRLTGNPLVRSAHPEYWIQRGR
jgi:tRNA 2-thiouridine synthesizing protein A